MVEIHEGLETGLMGIGEELVIVLGALGVQETVFVHQTGPLDRRAPRGKAQTLEKGEVLVVPVGEIVTRIGAHTVKEVLDPLVGPGVPKAVNLSKATPRTLGLGTRHGGAKEEVLGKLARLQHVLLSLPFLHVQI